MADCSAWTLTMSLPALMKSATLCSGSTIIPAGHYYSEPRITGRSYRALHTCLLSAGSGKAAVPKWQSSCSAGLDLQHLQLRPVRAQTWQVLCTG